MPGTSQCIVCPVPIYEYVCMECESHFEELVRGEQQVACPDCAATNVSRQFSTFAVHGVSKQPSFTGGGGGGCCGGSCGCGHYAVGQRGEQLTRAMREQPEAQAPGR